MPKEVAPAIFALVMTQTAMPKTEPVIKELELNCKCEHAFHVFVEQLGLWWPLKEHSCFEKNSQKVEVEKKVGGQVKEFSNTGDVGEWGIVLEWDPPKIFAMTWHPANYAELATRLKVEFAEVAPNKTKLKLIHDGWEIRGKTANEVRTEYNSGWNDVLDLYKKQCLQG